MGTVESSRVLLVDDDPALALVLADLLEAEFHQMETARDAATALQRASGEPFDLIILDVMLPGRSGFALCRDLRQRRIDTPLMMLTGRTAQADRIQGLMLGADDYVTKPFDPAELVARVHALLRRAGRNAQGRRMKEHSGEISVDFAHCRVEKHGQRVNLASKEAELLMYLAARPDQVVSRDELLTQVWGYRSSNTRTLDVHVAQLRRKLERNPATPRLLITARGQGYQFCTRAPNDM